MIHQLRLRFRFWLCRRYNLVPMAYHVEKLQETVEERAKRIEHLKDGLLNVGAALGPAGNGMVTAYDKAAAAVRAERFDYGQQEEYLHGLKNAWRDPTRPQNLIADTLIRRMDL